jgi:uncharacterized membrane protein YgcG
LRITSSPFFFSPYMKVFYNALGRLTAVLFCLLLQQCAQDLPRPVPTAPTPTTTASRFADAIARGEVHSQREKVHPTKQAPSGEPSKAGVPGAKLAQQTCYDYYLVYYDNTGAEVGRDFLYSDCPDGGGDVGSGGGGGSGGGDGGGSSGGGGGSSTGPSTTALSPNTILVIPPDKPISNFQQYIKCFTAS